MYRCYRRVGRLRKRKDPILETVRGDLLSGVTLLKNINKLLGQLTSVELFFSQFS